MNLFLRLALTLLFTRFRSRVSVMGPCRTPFRVLPTDLDVLMHMNNGVYFSLMDVARTDLLRRSGLFGPMMKRGWYPVVVAETMQFRRSLMPFQRFDIVTRVLAWDDKAFLVEQQFERRGSVVAVAYLRARFLSRSGGHVEPRDILALGGVDVTALPADVPEAAAQWNRTFATWSGRSPTE